MDGKAVTERVSIADASEHLGELVERAERGEAVELTRDGEAVARIVAMKAAGAPRQPVDLELLRSVSRTTPMQSESAGDFMRRLRDDARY